MDERERLAVEKLDVLDEAHELHQANKEAARNTVIRVYHWYNCAAEVVDHDLLEKVRRGGQGTTGNGVHASRSYATMLQDCEFCDKPVKIGEQVLMVKVTGNSPV